jgi:anhydro-N-acetylmuramic acid kinase
MSANPLWALGLMSGTSADGVDAALIRTDGVTITAFGPTDYLACPPSLKARILSVYGHPPGSETSLDQDITEHHVKVVEALLKKAGLKSQDIDVIGFHGQTVYHKPPCQGEVGHTYQLGDGVLLASLTGITVVNQFRQNDMAHGGQGAPLVPIYHQALARNMLKPLVVLNIGGVANLTWMGEGDEDLIAFDIGPGNGLIDDWVRMKAGLSWDEEGKLAAQGYVHEELLNQWIFHPYFAQKPPKSLDRKAFRGFSLEDGAATLTAFTAECLKKAMAHWPQKPLHCLVAGGGAKNPTLLHQCEKRANVALQKASDLSWNSDALEAQAFGYLAVRSLKNLPLSFPGTTGVSLPTTGGRIWKPEVGVKANLNL